MPRARTVKATGKDGDGDIISLNGAFGTVSRAEAIRQIESGKAAYQVGDTPVGVVNGQNGKYLRTQADGRTRNNLDNLPDG